MKIVACHGTDVEGIERFHCLAHFGSGAAAASILEHAVGNDPRVIFVEIEMMNAVWIPDNGCSTQDGSFYDAALDHLVMIGVMTRAMADEWWSGKDFEPRHSLAVDEGWSGIASILLDHGIDGLVYTNDVEDAGSLSFVAVHPDQVRVIETVRGREVPGRVLEIAPDPVASRSP